MRWIATSLMFGAALAVIVITPVGAAEQQVSSPDGSLRVTVSDSGGQAVTPSPTGVGRCWLPSPLGLDIRRSGMPSPPPRPATAD